MFFLLITDKTAVMHLDFDQKYSTTKVVDSDNNIHDMSSNRNDAKLTNGAFISPKSFGN